MKQFFVIVLVVLFQVTALADGAAVQFRASTSDLNVTLFTSPRPVAARDTRISILLQNKSGADTAFDAGVSLVIRGPSGSTVNTSAFQQRSGLYESMVVFDRAGKWETAVTLQRRGGREAIVGTLDVAPAPSRAVSYAGYIAFPPAMIVLFAVREYLLRRRVKR